MSDGGNLPEYVVRILRRLFRTVHRMLVSKILSIWGLAGGGGLQKLIFSGA